MLIRIIGLGQLYLLDAFALGVCSGRLPGCRRCPPPEGASAPTIRAKDTLCRLREGVRYLAGHRVLVAVLAVDLAAMVFALPVALLPELAERGYGGPAGGGLGLGLLFAAYPAGVLLAGMLSGTFSRAKRHGALMASAALLWGGCVVLLALATHLWLALLALAAGGGANFVLSTFRNAISQAYTDDGLRGRIQGLLTVVLMGGPQLANLLHGFAGAVLGVRWTIGAGGALTVLTVARQGGRPADLLLRRQRAATGGRVDLSAGDHSGPEHRLRHLHGGSRHLDFPLGDGKAGARSARRRPARTAGG